MSNTTYLAQQEIRELTGCTQHAAQMRALADMGFVAVRGRDGAPRVLRAHHNRVLGLDDRERHGPAREPDLSFLDGNS